MKIRAWASTLAATILGLVVFAGAPSTASAEEMIIKNPGDHPVYRIELEPHEDRRAQVEPARHLGDDHLGDEHAQALAGAPELAHIGAEVVGLDDARQRPALAQRRDIARDGDGRDHAIGASSASRRRSVSTSKSAAGQPSSSERSA